MTTTLQRPKFARTSSKPKTEAKPKAKATPKATPKPVKKRR